MKEMAKWLSIVGLLVTIVLVRLFPEACIVVLGLPAAVPTPPGVVSGSTAE